MTQLKIFVPDSNEIFLNKGIVPFLQPFYKNDLSLEERVSKYGEWIKKIDIVDSIKNCDLVMPAHYVNFYYQDNKQRLTNYNKHANNHYKVTVCWTNGDWGVTPKLINYHLYRYGGYLSKNKGNQFCYPRFFVIDPVTAYYNNTLDIHQKKPLKPVVGFCGRASNSQFFVMEDLVKNYGRLALKLINKRHEDFEKYYGSSLKRYEILQQLEHSDLLDTNFIKNEQYFGEENSSAPKNDVQKIFYRNLRDSHYILCFRGWGNFSLRLYETLAAGRIPIIISSDNNLPFMQKINWNIFPIIDSTNIYHIAEYLSAFHSSLKEEEFIHLQLNARKIWEDFINYQGFMEKIVEQYLAAIIR
jgi:hypothetical protein